MSFVNAHSYWNMTGLAATVAVHLALLAVAASAFHVAGTKSGKEDERFVAIFTAPRPVADVAKGNKPDAGTPAPARQRPPASLPAQSSKTPVIGSQGDRPVKSLSQPLTTTFERTQAPAQPSLVTVPLERPAVSREDDEAVDRLSQYVAKLRNAIMQWKPRGMRKEGTVTIGFRLDREGGLISSRIVQSSNDIQIDRQALRMVRQATPFPAPAAEIPSEKLDFSISVNFH